MSKDKKTPGDFRPTQVVSPVPSGRRYGKWKPSKKTFNVHVDDIETGAELFTAVVQATGQREAIAIVKKRHKTSALLRNVTHAAYIAVEVKDQ